MTASPLERPDPYKSDSLRESRYTKPEPPFDDDARRRTGTRAGRSAVSRRRAHRGRLRYASLRRLFAIATLLTLAFVVYLGLMANLTRLNYELSKAAHEKARLVERTSRLDDRIARLESREHLEALARQLKMHEAQTFIAVNLPPAPRAETPRGLAFLTWLK